ncbi:hypothetical protein MLP_50270 [Microlunatus phosphovorus NM-1]|uniref:Band 7 domain-containing protein n=1 Tax=Microlunatus phosphovorus (strain ATCC 700054 / DSM 10555 / JCM 9379 / NBRC 101784 / NCIMB 13414 / VKM Ac-1990 / NM-1) TaxID=1032480 RepID=F5XGA7_MICPN|nr:SPFH domain-containing protein [Microlunatus phosphovorus]BAK38041.1 hypothetical protein MLP_50270 [Microlunatus phosphovorus NM-1]
MNLVGWIILVVLLVPAVGILAWVVLSESFLRIPSGRLGLLLVRGRPTDAVLSPGLHFVPALRRRTVVTYPSTELSYRVGGEPEPVDQAGLDSCGPAIEVYLGDRTRAVVGYTVRYRLRLEGLRDVHLRFGPGGIGAAVRDCCHAGVTAALGAEQVGVDDLFGPAREALQREVGEQLTAELAETGFELASFQLRSVDLGRTGEAVQAVVRARHELAAENAAAETRIAQLSNDQDLVAQAGSAEAPWRYRETELWRELILRRENLNVTLPAGVRPLPGPGGLPPDPAAPLDGSGEPGAERAGGDQR